MHEPLRVHEHINVDNDVAPPPGGLPATGLNGGVAPIGPVAQPPQSATASGGAPGVPIPSSTYDPHAHANESDNANDLPNNTFTDEVEEDFLEFAHHTIDSNDLPLSQLSTTEAHALEIHVLVLT